MSPCAFNPRNSTIAGRATLTTFIKPEAKPGTGEAGAASGGGGGDEGSAGAEGGVAPDIFLYARRTSAAVIDSRGSNAPDGGAGAGNAAGDDAGSAEHPAVWQADRDAPQCNLCQQLFTFTRRRHHCRHCGRVVCSSCSPHKVSHQRSGDAVRTCTQCFDDFQAIAAAALSGDDVGGGGAGASSLLDHSEQLKSLSVAQEAWEQEKQQFNTAEDLDLDLDLGDDIEPVVAVRPAVETWWSLKHDYSRLGLDEHAYWQITDWNQDYTLCPTYPSSLVLPKALDRRKITSAASFRSKRRSGTVPPAF